MVLPLVSGTVVFPTCVGMNRSRAEEFSAVSRVPHMRGDEPDAEPPTHEGGLCSPHAWG